MAIKSICCISSKKDWQDSLQLSKRVKEKTGIGISVLNSSDSTTDYDMVVYVHSKNATEDTQVAKWLKEASDLNKTFVPVILGGNWLSNKLDILKYKGPNLRSSFLQLRKDEDFLEFCNTLTSFTGKELTGDAYGATVDYVFDVDCKIIEDGVVLAEISSNKITPVTLYKGVHRLIYQPNLDSLMSKEEVIDIKDNDQHPSIDYHFCERVLVSSDLSCDVFQNDRLVTRIEPNDASYIALIAGKCNIRFQSVQYQNVSKTINIEVKHDSNNPITTMFTGKVQLKSDLACDIYQDGWFMASIEENQTLDLPLILGKSKVVFKSKQYPDCYKEFGTHINTDGNSLEARFVSKVRLKSDADCKLYQDNRLLCTLEKNCTKDVALFIGKCILSFQSVESPQYSLNKSLNILLDNNDSICANLQATVRIKSDTKGILKDNNQELMVVNPFKSYDIKVFKGVHDFVIVDADNEDNYRNKKKKLDDDTTITFSLENKHYLSRKEQFNVFGCVDNEYSQLISERQTLKEQIMSFDKEDVQGINELTRLDELIEAIEEGALKNKAISDIIESLQSPIRNVLSSLNSAPNTIMGLLTSLQQY